MVIRRFVEEIEGRCCCSDVDSGMMDFVLGGVVVFTSCSKYLCACFCGGFDYIFY